MLNRRQFLRRSALGVGAACISVHRPFLHAWDEPGLELRARPGRAALVDTDNPTEIWGYNGRSPGPLLRVSQDDSISVGLRNDLPMPTTIHWHGIRIDNAMDGVGNLTQAPVEPGETFSYRFSAPDAGTFWYHPHFRSWEAMARGLYGMLIVEEHEAPFVDQDIVLILDDWRLDEDDRLDERSLGNLHDAAHAGRLGNVLTANSHPGPTIPVRFGERIRVRLLNAANARVMNLEFAGLAPQVVALDGQPVSRQRTPQARLTLSPGARADLLVDVDLEPERRASLKLITRGGEVPAAEFLAGPERARSAPLISSFALPSNPLATALSLADSHRLELSMEGGAMGRMNSARYQGEQFSMRELAAKGQAWSLNGEAGMPEKPLFSVARGRTVEVAMLNDTRWPHAMHFHGHHVQVQSTSAHDQAGTWRDTVLVDTEENLSVAFVADNPGRWMVHCHMLEHQAAGMATWFEVL